jgi:hypothetical protein
VTVAEYTEDTTTLRIRRWRVPAPEPYGAAAAEIGKAWSVAERAYRQHHGIKENASVADNALTFHNGDEEIIIEFRYEIRETTA